jgi:UDP-N-acetylmuramoylalanine--D-glutamate ligase
LPIRYTQWGNHESENVLAAWIACKEFGVSSQDFSTSLETFQKPAHRIEFVASIQGVDYFDDSKGTNIDATIKAVEAMTRKVVLIAGGVDKGASYLPWKAAFAGKVCHVLALGQAAQKISHELAPEFTVEIIPDLKEAVRRASIEAKAGDAVLLSPGCSSFDMFRDYADRGEKFKQLVLELRREE